jgi:hypothetical protein
MQSNSKISCVEKCRQTIASIDWFANVGGDFDLELPMPVSRVKTWGSATRKANSLKWENTTLEAQNHMLGCAHAYEEHVCKWNEIVKMHQQHTVSHLEEKVWKPWLEDNGLDLRLVDSFSWDMLGVLREASFRELFEHDVDFFGQLLRVYAAGHFPCGWKGRYPSGTLIVF